MRRVFIKVATTAAAGVLAVTAASTLQTAGAAVGALAYFVMTDITREEFVIKLTEPWDIEHARELVSGETTDSPHVLTRMASYKPRWSYHNNSDATQFFDRAIEVCDATIPYVEDHLDEAGGPFLPGLFWCDWTSRPGLVREIPAP